MFFSDQERTIFANSLLEEMKNTATRMRDLILAMPPHDLIGYIYTQLMMMKVTTDCTAAGEQSQNKDFANLLNESQFLLEYVHAVLASYAASEDSEFDEAQCAEMFELGRQLKGQAMAFAMVTSADTKDGIFGPETADIEIQAKSKWVTLRGNRYQVLEGEFYRYVLAPHNDVLQEVYGVGANHIAEGFQAIADAARSGIADAIMQIQKQFEAAQVFAAAQHKPLDEVIESWVTANAEQSKAVGQAMDNIFRGGIANVSRHTKLPQALLADLAYRRGEETDFFAAGDFAGTPYRTLPARKKPLIQLGSDYYAVDPCFARDAGYRALLYNLLQRKPDYKKTFEARQKWMSEAAFADILAAQLPSATIFQDDVLFLVEAKAGAAASIASPALDFSRHTQSVQDLVLKAYNQCERFFSYLDSADEVALYQIIDGKYKECGRIRRADYRVKVPIGLTVESFAPFSTYCKELPQIEPLLGKHAFVSLSIDDLFVLKRLLPTPGEFVHYMEVRQAAAGIRRAHLYDEFDHLGAYLKKNRFDQELAKQLQGGSINMLTWHGMSDIVDKVFAGEDWENVPRPMQDFPDEVQNLLRALDVTRTRGWLSAESHIRDLGEEGRNNLARMLSDLRQTLNQHPARYFTLAGDREPLFIWLQQHDRQIDWIRVNDKASAVALAVKAANVIGIVAEVSATGTFHRAQYFAVRVPTERTEENAHVYEDAGRMAHPNRQVTLSKHQ